MKFKRLVAGGLSAAAALSLSVLLPSEASADVINGCPSGSFCGWEDVMYSGRIQVTEPGLSQEYYNFGVTSYWNRTKFDICLTSKTSERKKKVVPGEQTYLLDPPWNDDVRSVSVYLGAIFC
jgi:hypothetical protein